MDENRSDPANVGDPGSSLPSGFSRKRSLGTVDTVDPADAIGGNDGTSDSEPRKRRGRQPGTKNRPKTEAPKISVDVLGSILVSIHGMMAAVTKVEELSLSEPEGTQLAKAMNEVAKHYNVAVAEKGLAWTGLITCLGQLYGPRAVAYSMRRKMEKEEAASAHTVNNANVAQFGKVN